MLCLGNGCSKSMQKSIDNHYAKSTVRESLKITLLKENANLGRKNGGKASKKIVNNHIKSMQDADKSFVRGTKKFWIMDSNRL